MSGGVKSGQGQYAPLITEDHHHLNNEDIAIAHATSSPISLATGISPTRQSRGPSMPPRRSFSIPHRSLSRVGFREGANGEGVLELHFASVKQKRVKWWKDAAITCLFIASWFLFATLLSVYNKWMFSPEYLAFPFPLFVTTLHMIVQWTLASLVRWIWPARFKPEVDPSRRDYATKAVPAAIATSLDIGLSNLSLKLITLSFYTMCKSSSLIFVLLFAFLLHLERPSLRLIGVIALITCGVLLMVFTTTEFSLPGLILVLSASFLGGPRWGLTQLLLKKRDMGMNNPAATIFWLAPSMIITLGLVSMAVEGWITVWRSDFWARVGWAKSLLYLFSPGSVTFAMIMSEYYVITRAGAVPLSIAGIFKEVTTITIAAWIFGDHLTELNMIGVGVTITGIALFTYHKYTSALHSAVPLDAHGNPLEEEDAEEVLAVVRGNTGDALYNEEGLRLLEDGGEIEVPVSALAEYGDDDEEGEDEVAKRNRGVRLLEEVAEGGHGDGEIVVAGNKPMDERPLFSVGDIEEEFENGNPVVAGTREEGSREVGGTGERREWR